MGTHAASPSSSTLIRVIIKFTIKFSRPKLWKNAVINAVEAPHIVDAKFASSTPSSHGSPGNPSSPQPSVSIVPFPLRS